jgi:histidine triad (HIT) family protein
MVYRDERVAAFMDIQPVNPGHVLIVPVRHATSLDDLDPELAARLMTVGQQVFRALRHSNLKCEGVNFSLADGEAGDQEVPHVHLHVFPRFEGDGFGLRFGPAYTTLPPRAELDAVATEIRRWLSS